MTSRAKLSRMLGVLLLALFIGATTVTAPATASAGPADRGLELTIVKAPAGTSYAPDTVCAGPFAIDPWAVFFDCAVDVPTTFSPTCSNGFAFTPATLPPGLWRII